MDSPQERIHLMSVKIPVLKEGGMQQPLTTGVLAGASEEAAALHPTELTQATNLIFNARSFRRIF